MFLSVMDINIHIYNVHKVRHEAGLVALLHALRCSAVLHIASVLYIN